MAMQESGEMYLETIYVLSQRLPSVRSIDVAAEMGFSKPSVSRGLGILKNTGLAITDASGNIFLTDEGTKRAKKIYERHTVLSELFKLIGISEETADDDACRVEHYISDETFKALKKHLKELKK